MDEVNQLHLVIPSRRDSSHRHMTKRFLLGLSSGKDASRWPGPLLFTAACWQCDGIVKDLVQEVITLKKEWVFFFLKNLFIPLSIFAHGRVTLAHSGNLLRSNKESPQVFIPRLTVKIPIKLRMHPALTCGGKNKPKTPSDFHHHFKKMTLLYHCLSNGREIHHVFNTYQQR